MRTPAMIIASLVLLLFVGGLTSGEDDAPPQRALPDIEAAVAQYLQEIEEIERVAARRKAEARARLERAMHNVVCFRNESGRYRGMLGSYFNADGRIPFILLSAPNGENVLGELARLAFNGRSDAAAPLRRFLATGHVVIAEEGVYRLEASRGYEDVRLNELGYTLGTPIPDNRYSAEVELVEGVYDVTFSVGNNGGQLAEAFFRIVHAQTGRELPLFVYESELTEFAGDLSLGAELIEVSNWSREGAELD